MPSAVLTPSTVVRLDNATTTDAYHWFAPFYPTIGPDPAQVWWLCRSVPGTNPTSEPVYQGATFRQDNPSTVSAFARTGSGVRLKNTGGDTPPVSPPHRGVPHAAKFHGAGNRHERHGGPTGPGEKSTALESIASALGVDSDGSGYDECGDGAASPTPDLRSPEDFVAFREACSQMAATCRS